MAQPPDHVYLGDGVYASHDGYQVWLAVGNHESPVAALEPAVLQKLAVYAIERGYLVHADFSRINLMPPVDEPPVGDASSSDKEPGNADD